MAKGITGKEPDPREVYADIIGHPHRVSRKHPPMSLHDRAAQFAPFAALSGYEDMIEEEARPVNDKIELGGEDLEELNRKLNAVSEAIRRGVHPEAAITRFVPDPLKPGGMYETTTERIRRVDPVGGTIQLERKTSASGSYMEIRIGDILDIREDG